MVYLPKTGHERGRKTAVERKEGMERRENTVLPGSSNMVGLRGVPRLIVRPLARGAGEEAFGCSERWGGENARVVV